MKMKRNEKGFTLVEVIVVLAIIAILASFLIPSMTGWINNAQEKSAIVECRNVVMATKEKAVEQYAQGTYSSANLNAASSEILLLAEAPGQIEEIDSLTDVEIKFNLIYQAENGKYVLYKDNTYTVSDVIPNVNTVASYLNTSSGLLENAIAMKKYNNTVWGNLRDLYKASYNDTFPSISETEKGYLIGVSLSTLSSLTWKPTILGTNGTDGIMMIGSNSTSSNNAYLIYYNDSYYYHDNGYGHKDSNFVSDQGTFNTTLLTNPSSSGSRWIKVE